MITDCNGLAQEVTMSSQLVARLDMLHSVLMVNSPEGESMLINRSVPMDMFGPWPVDQ